MRHSKHTTNFHSADSIVCHLKNQIREALWEGLAPEFMGEAKSGDDILCMEKFFSINRKMGDILDKFIGTFSVELRHLKPYYTDDHFGRVQYDIARQIADGIVESDSVVVREYNSVFSPEVIFIAQVPFLKLQDEMKRDPAAQETKGEGE